MWEHYFHTVTYQVRVKAVLIPSNTAEGGMQARGTPVRVRRGVRVKGYYTPSIFNVIAGCGWCVRGCPGTPTHCTSFGVYARRTHYQQNSKQKTKIILSKQLLLETHFIKLIKCLLNQNHSHLLHLRNYGIQKKARRI